MTFRHDEQGTTALELALCAPLLILFVLLVFEAGLQATVAAALDFGARRAGRLGITGAITANGPVATDAERRAALRAAVLSASGTLLVDGRLTLSQASYGTMAGAAAGKNAITGPGGAGQVVRYDLTYVQPLLTGSLAASVLQRTEFVHTSSIVVVNEQFPAR